VSDLVRFHISLGETSKNYLIWKSLAEKNILSAAFLRDLLNHKTHKLYEDSR
jgi:hypothetical protein